MGRNYTQAELEILLKTGIIPGRSRVSNRVARTKLNLRQKRASRPAWSADEKQKLRELHAQGLSARQIVAQGLLGKSLMAIQKQLGRMGLAKGFKLNRLSHETRELFRAFLRENFQNHTPLELTQAWNEKYPQHAVSKKQTVSYLTRMQLKISYAEVIRLQNLKKKEQLIWAQHVGRDPKVTQQAIREQRLKLLQNRVARGRDLWTGLQLPPDEQISPEEDSLA